jgi:thiol-disulfide isomerase/thioredoxin
MRQQKLEALAESDTRAAAQDSQGIAIQSEVQSQEGMQPQTSEQEPVTGPASGGTGETSGQTPAQTPNEAGTLAIAVDSAAPSTEPAPTAASSRTVGGKLGNQSPELEGIVAWINSEPLTVAALRGKVVLVDFWTYTCINCIRTMPFLKQWYSRYQDDGLVILGVHAPEFDFEKDLSNVVNATLDYSITWPVAMDNDFETWRNFSNRFWPAKYLIDKDGVVRYTHFGEGKYAETEKKIQELLAETGVDLSGATFALPEDQTVDPLYRKTRNASLTRELYAGYERGYSDFRFGRGGYVAQEDYYRGADSVVSFKAPATLSGNQLYFNGPWHVGPESVKHGRTSENYEDHISLVYSARSVNVVLTSDSGRPYRVRITVDGKFLTEETKGADITIGSDGESYLLVTEPKMYNILENPSYVQKEILQMSSNSPDFGLFAFTFGVYKKGT